MLCRVIRYSEDAVGAEKSIDEEKQSQRRGLYC